MKTMQSEKKTYIDRASGVEVTQLTEHKGHSHHFYFTNSGWYAQGRKLLFASDRNNRTNLFGVDLESGEIEQLTDLDPVPLPREVEFLRASKNPVREEVYFWHDLTLLALDIASRRTRTLLEIDPRWCVSMSNCSADGRHVYFGSWEDQSHKFEVDLLRGYIGFGETWAAMPRSRIERVDLDTGRHEIVFEESYWIGHINTSPIQPEILTFCHEGPWDKVDNRIWGLDAGSGKVWKIRPPAAPGDIVGHEYWFNDGIHVGFHGHTSQGKPMLGHVRFDNSGLCEYEFPGETGHIFSLDDKLIVGDGAGVIRIWRREGDRYSQPRLLCRHDSAMRIQQTHPHPRISPDGRYVVFSSDRSGYGNVYRVPLVAFDSLPPADPQADKSCQQRNQDTMPIGHTMMETIASAETAVRAAAPVAAADSQRPAFHFRPPAQWMNDICGALWHEGWYHIFYQFNPFADRSDWSCVNACWGHAHSRDLVHWEHLPIAVAPSVEEDNYQCVSGCATHRADGTPMLFYGHTPLPRPDGTRPPRQQWAALPLDPELCTWQTLDVGLAPGQSGVPADIAGCWTDMFIFREAGRTFAIFKEAGGLVVEAQNPELTRWQAVGRIDGVFGECPNFIKLQDRWLLLRSTYPMSYQVGRFDPERIAFEMDGPAGIVDYSYGLNPPPDPGDPNYYLDASGVPVCRYGAPYPAHADSRGFYATSVFADSAGRTILLAWVGAWPASRGWNCCMSLPRVLSFDAAGRLVQQPIPELTQLRGDPVTVGPLTLKGEARRIEGFTGDALEVMADFELAAAATVELALCDDTGAAAVRIRYDGRTLDANGTVLPRVLGDDPRRLKLHLFYDKSVMELFINDGLQTVTRVALPPSAALHLEAAACGGVATLRSVTVWPIEQNKGIAS